MQQQSAEGARDIVMAATRAFVGVAAQALLAVGDDVSLPQYRVLVLLDEQQPQTMGALADRLALKPSTVTRVCDRLADKRLITRHVDENDRRSVRVQLTRRGQRLVDAVTQARRITIGSILDRMGTAAERRLAASLADFAAAAGEAPDHAWTLGWSGGPSLATGEPNRTSDRRATRGG
jgi:DNA-binding MarR family transcriptional regulator